MIRGWITPGAMADWFERDAGCRVTAGKMSQLARGLGCEERSVVRVLTNNIEKRQVLWSVYDYPAVFAAAFRYAKGRLSDRPKEVAKPSFPSVSPDNCTLFDALRDQLNLFQSIDQIEVAMKEAFLAALRSGEANVPDVLSVICDPVERRLYLNWDSRFLDKVFAHHPVPTKE